MHGRAAGREMTGESRVGVGCGIEWRVGVATSSSWRMMVEASTAQLMAGAIELGLSRGMD